MVEDVMLGDEGSRRTIWIRKKHLTYLRTYNKEIRSTFKKFKNEKQRHHADIQNLDKLPAQKEEEPSSEDPEEEKMVRRLLDHFQGRTRQVFRLCYLSGLKPGEAAKKLGISPKTVSNLKSEITKELRRIKKREEDKRRKKNK